MLPELFRVADNKLSCHLIILSDWDLPNRAQHVLVALLGEEDPAFLNFIIALCLQGRQRGFGPIPLLPTAQRTDLLQPGSARASAYTPQSHHILRLPNFPGRFM